VHGTYSSPDQAATTAYGYAEEVSTFSTVLTTPARVKGLKSTKGKKKVNLKWSGVSGATGYHVYRSKSQASGFKKIKTVGSPKYTDQKVKRRARYYYKVRAYRIVSGQRFYGEYSKTVSARSK